MRFTIALKMYCIVGVAFFALAAIAGFSYYTVHRLVNSTEQIIKESVTQKDLSSAGQISLGNAVQAYKNYLVRKDGKYVTNFKAAVGEIEKDIKDYLDISVEEDKRAAARKASDALDQYRGCIDKLVALRAQSDDITSVDQSIQGIDKPLSEALNDMGTLATKDLDASRKKLADSSDTLITILLFCSGIAALLTTGYGIYVARNLSTRLNRVANAMGVVADGDLSTRLRIYGDDEIGDMGKSINRMLDSFNSMINSIKGTALQVASAAGQLYSTAEQMATGTEEVAAQTGTVATASEEMAATSTEIANNCGSAAEEARHASEAALSGTSIVQETIRRMRLIAEQVKESATTVESLGARSDQIGEIIGTIEDIADQTNLLALNAAIEAARAGEQGRGFAVVADEVRALAERTTKATKEIGAMIRTIQNETRDAVSTMESGVREVEDGTSEAAKSGAALEEILGKINAVTMQISQVATAAEQQTATTTEISHNVQQITEVVLETSKGAQESATAASRLSQLAEELRNMMEQFKVAV
jgi:methyl-accepting chemotaxis protein